MDLFQSGYFMLASTIPSSQPLSIALLQVVQASCFCIYEQELHFTESIMEPRTWRTWPLSGLPAPQGGLKMLSTGEEVRQGGSELGLRSQGCARASVL